MYRESGYRESGQAVTVRRMYAEDVPSCRASLKTLLQTCTDISFSGEVSDGFYEKKLQDLLSYLQRSQAYLFGAFQETHLLGFLWACRLPDPLGEKLHISYFAVLPEYAGRGIGSRLLEAAQAQARELGLERTELIVSRSNEQALGFYEKQGFQIQRYVLIREVNPR